MNAVNACIFVAMGSAMELLARAFPAWFPMSGADMASARALWLHVMGSVQVGIGLGYMVRASVIPFVARLVSVARTADAGSLALPKARSVIGR